MGERFWLVKERKVKRERGGGGGRAPSGCRCSHGIFSGPLSGGGFVLGLVSLVNVSDFWYKWVIRVGISQQGAD